jgi:hypothetical protein
LQYSQYNYLDAGLAKENGENHDTQNNAPGILRCHQWKMVSNDNMLWMKHDEAYFFWVEQALWDKSKISHRWTAKHPGVASEETQTRISYDQQTKTFG